MLDRLRRKFFTALTNWAREHNRIHTSEGSRLGNNLSLQGASLYGNVSIGDNCKIREGAVVYAMSKISIGRFTSITGPNTNVTANINPITIGSFCSIASNVTIQESNHRLDSPTTYHIHFNVIDGDYRKDDVSKGSIEIGNDVWIGTHCVILTGVKIGDGAVIAANSTVVSDVPPYAIAGGSPAKVISYRFQPDVIAALQNLRWWEWPVEKIKANREFFGASVTKESIEKAGKE
jgi:virginiamycin A acetyltransferase